MVDSLLQWYASYDNVKMASLFDVWYNHLSNQYAGSAFLVQKVVIEIPYKQIEFLIDI